MVKFDHPNVLKLIGVCLDGGPAPFIIMPFMANGSLLTYLKKNRQELVLSQDCKDNENVSVNSFGCNGRVYRQMHDSNNVMCRLAPFASD